MKEKLMKKIETLIDSLRYKGTAISIGTTLDVTQDVAEIWLRNGWAKESTGNPEGTQNDPPKLPLSTPPTPPNPLAELLKELKAMPRKLVTAPEGEPVSLEQAKGHLNMDLDDNSQDDWINTAIAAAREFCEDKTGRKFIAQTWDLFLSSWPEKKEIPIAPNLLSITEVTYKPKSGAEQTLDPALYEVDDVSIIGRLVLDPDENWPTDKLKAANPICIRHEVGYGAAADVPEKLKQAMLMLISHWNENREAVGSVGEEIAFSVNSLLSSETILC